MLAPASAQPRVERFLGQKALPSPHTPILGCGFKSQLQPLISSVFLCSQDGLKLHPEMLQPVLKAKKWELGST